MLSPLPGFPMSPLNILSGRPSSLRATRRITSCDIICQIIFLNHLNSNFGKYNVFWATHITFIIKVSSNYISEIRRKITCTRINRINAVMAENLNYKTNFIIPCLVCSLLFSNLFVMPVFLISK